MTTTFILLGVLMKGFLSVSPKDKVATTWGDIKHRAIIYR